jgi:electron transfer flavoprotein alpha subunit
VVARRDRLVGLTDVQDAPVAEPVEAANEVCDGPYVVGADVRQPIAKLIPAADVDERETVIQQPPHLADRRVASDEDAAIGELEAAERTLATGRGFGSRQACEQQVVALGAASSSIPTRNG